MPVPGFRVVLPPLLLVIDPVFSTTFSIKLQMDPQSVEASLQEQPVITVSNYVDVIGSYCYTYVTDRVCHRATSTLYFK